MNINPELRWIILETDGINTTTIQSTSMHASMNQVNFNLINYVISLIQFQIEVVSIYVQDE